MKIYLATGNKNKKREMQELLPEHTVLIPSDEGIEFDPIEDGKTFYENSLIKARTLYNIVKAPVIADDSGICVDALGGEPGIFSSRFAGPANIHGNPDGSKMPQDEQNIAIISMLNDAIKSGNLPKMPYIHGERSCHYTCAMVMVAGPDRLFVAQETFEGTIIDDIKKQAGSNGFGYDPIVFLPEYNKTIAQLTPEEKNAISHRGKAVRSLKKLIEIL